MKTSHYYILLIFIVFSLTILVGCEQDNVVLAEKMKIFYNSKNGANNDNRRVLDIIALDNNNLLIFGITGKNSTSRFDGDGKIFLLKTNTSGDILFYHVDSLGNGFPSNVIRTENGIGFVWNLFATNNTDRLKIVQVEADGISPVVTIQPAVNEQFSPLKAVIRIARKTNKSGFYSLGILSYDIDGKMFNRFSVMSFSNDFELETVLNGYDFDAANFDVYNADYLKILENLDPFLFITAYKESYFFNIPYKNAMQLFYGGLQLPLLNDSWTRAVIENSDNGIALLTSDSQNETPILKSYTFEKNQLTLDNSNALTQHNDIEIASQIVASMHPSSHEIYLAATTYVGQLFVNNVTNGGINGERIGNTYRYEIGNWVWLNNGEKFVISGTTKVRYQTLCPYIIVFNTNEFKTN